MYLCYTGSLKLRSYMQQYSKTKNVEKHTCLMEIYKYNKSAFHSSLCFSKMTDIFVIVPSFVLQNYSEIVKTLAQCFPLVSWEEWLKGVATALVMLLLKSF